MSKITFGPATLEALKYIEANLRKADCDEFVYSTGRDPKGLFARCTPLEGSIIGYVDGRPACVFGCEDMESHGAPWLMGTADLQGRAVARALVKYGRRQFREWARKFGTLRNYAFAFNDLHIRYIKALGCEVSAPQPYGPLSGPFREFTYGLRRLEREAEGEGACSVPQVA